MMLEIIGRSLDFLGKLLIAFTAIIVHHRVLREHKIDRKVFFEMKREQLLGLLGVFLLCVGYLIEIAGKLQQG